MKVSSVIIYGYDSPIPVIQYHGIHQSDIHCNLNGWKWWRTTDQYSYASNIEDLNERLGGIRFVMVVFGDGRMVVTDPRDVNVGGNCILDNEVVWEDFINNCCLYCL